MNTTKFKYVLRLADHPMILGQRLGEWCGHGPVLEQDIALTNIALDLIGEARSLYQYAAEVEGKGRTEDDLAFLRLEKEYQNFLLVEQPNEDFAYTIVRQFFFDIYHHLFFTALQKSNDEHLAAIAEKSIKEVSYHQRFSSEWMIRLGDGTDVSHQKMQTALDDLWTFSGELMTMDELDEEAVAAGYGVNLAELKDTFDQRVDRVLKEATLQKPEGDWMQKGGKQGIHTEHLGYILAEMQHLQRAYPGAEW